MLRIFKAQFVGNLTDGFFCIKNFFFSNFNQLQLNVLNGSFTRLFFNISPR